MKVKDFQDFPVPELQYKIPITKSAEERKSQQNLTGILKNVLALVNCRGIF